MPGDSAAQRFVRSFELRWHAFCVTFMVIPLAIGMRIAPERFTSMFWVAVGGTILSLTLMRIYAHDQRRRRARLAGRYPSTPFATRVTLRKESAPLLGLPFEAVRLMLVVTDDGLDLVGWPSKRLVVRVPWSGLASVSRDTGWIGRTPTKELHRSSAIC